MLKRAKKNFARKFAIFAPFPELPRKHRHYGLEFATRRHGIAGVYKYGREESKITLYICVFGRKAAFL